MVLARFESHAAVQPVALRAADHLDQTGAVVQAETRSQDFETIYRVNGGFYIAWLDKFFEKDNFFQGRVKAYVMDSLHSVDIDYQVDLEWAEFLLANHYISI